MIYKRVGRSARFRARRLVNSLRDRSSGLPAPDEARGEVVTTPAEPVDDVETISTIEQLDAKLREVDAAYEVSDDAMRAVFNSFRMVPPADFPADPWSGEYRDKVFEIYHLISGRPDYEVDNERSDFPVDPKRPFPYYTESPDTVGAQLMAVGFIIATMGLPARSSILELGPGWGNTTVALARMGYEVTAIDIDPTFAQLIRDRAALIGTAVDSRQGTFLEIDQLDRTFDAVLFYECFHHCSDHRSLLEKLAGVLNPGGRVFFAAEPITDAFPWPWGVRLDGESLWAIRANGWLELGFQESYFLRCLHRLGWVTRKHATDATHLGNVIEAWRANGRYPLASIRLPPDEDSTWLPPDGPGGLAGRYSTGASRISIDTDAVYSQVVIHGRNSSPSHLRYSLFNGRHTTSGLAPPGEDIRIVMPYDPEAGLLEIHSETWRPSVMLGSADGRDLGLAVFIIELLGAPTAPATAEEATSAEPVPRELADQPQVLRAPPLAPG